LFGGGALPAQYYPCALIRMISMTTVDNYST